MLACPAPEALQFPYYVSHKLDGVRCMIVNGVAVSRKLEVIPNAYVQHMLGSWLLNGLDGELTVGPAYADNVMQETTSGVMSRDGTPDFHFHVFDYHNGPEGAHYASRYAMLQHAFGLPTYKSHPRMSLLPHVIVNDQQTLETMQMAALEQGYEGLMLRAPHGPYKFGRSTAKQGWLMKLKQFADGEADVIGVEELCRNENELGADAMGLAKRSKAKDGMVPAGMLGALVVKDRKSGVQFNIGSGFTMRDRAQLWADHTGKDAQYSIIDGGEEAVFTVSPTGVPVLGRISVYRHFEKGVKDKPRFPVWHGFRDPKDMGATDE